MFAIGPYGPSRGRVYASREGIPVVFLPILLSFHSPFLADIIVKEHSKIIREGNLSISKQCDVKSKM